MISTLSDANFAPWLAANPNAVVLGWMENCTYCDQFKPIFQLVAEEPAFSELAFSTIMIPRSGSEFKRLYMKANLGEKTGAPCTFLFSNGEFLRRHHGLLTVEQLRQFLTSGKVNAVSQTKTLQQLSIVELKASWLDQILTVERAQAVIRAIQTELDLRSSPGVNAV
jgi:thiol-disulfide isomerase/thioredoxin